MHSSGSSLGGGASAHGRLGGRSLPGEVCRGRQVWESETRNHKKTEKPARHVIRRGQLWYAHADGYTEAATVVGLFACLRASVLFSVDSIWRAAVGHQRNGSACDHKPVDPVVAGSSPVALA